MVAVALVRLEIVVLAGIPVRGLAAVRVPDPGAVQVARVPVAVTSTWRPWGRDSERISPISVAKGAAVREVIADRVVHARAAVRVDLAVPPAAPVLRRHWRGEAVSP
ncbi:MAG: hypothetical protein GEEBNDBF_00540 [bacterium]|nr:hypothetical protein [bacterium]